jgi:hypothetical protein
MPVSLSDFIDDTEFERYALDRATPLLPKSPGTSIIELADPNSTSVTVGAGVATATVHVGMSDSAGATVGGLGQVGAEVIRPLLFGAAWKVLDQLIEFALEQSSVPHDRAGRDYTIKLKTREAINGNIVPVAPFVSDPDLWTRVIATYASTEEVRNSLTHRRLVVDPVTGDISGVPRPGQLAPPVLTVAQQLAFCRVAVGAAGAIISGTLTTRLANQLKWTLDQLAFLHRQPAFGTAQAQGVIPLVIYRPTPGPSGDLTVDFTDIVERARAAVMAVSYYDLELHLPDGRVLAAPLEDAPQGNVTFAIANPPGWLQPK